MFRSKYSIITLQVNIIHECYEEYTNTLFIHNAEL